MAEASPTPVSGGESTPARTPAPKDKHCPYCDQLFTSSSLGRHLDLYIKEKNPKPPDGVHDIDEIRKLRGGITRRSARSSSVKRENTTPANPKPSPAASSQRSASDGSAQLTSAQPVMPPTRSSINEATWQVTGVIRDIPSAALNDGATRVEARRDSMRKYSVKSGVEHKEKLREALDQGRAAELALREVLDSLRIATARARPPPSPLPFDVFALTFPALVLQCLSPPPTLYSTQPFPTVNSWSLDPPGEMQLQALVDWLRGQYRQWKTDVTRSEGGRVDRLGSISHRSRELGGGHPDGGRTGLTAAEAQDREDGVVKHALDAYSHWELLAEKQKQDAWRLEILRAYSREKEKRHEVEVRLEEVLQDVEHCKAQVDRLSRCQQPREFFLKPPTPMPVPKDTLRELNGVSSVTPDWDYDRVLSKWKMVVQENRRSVSGMAGQKPLSSLPENLPPSMHAREIAPLTSRLTNGSSSSSSGFVAPPPLPSPMNGEPSDDADEMEDAVMEDGVAGPPPSSTPIGRSSRAPPPPRPAALMSRGSIVSENQAHLHDSSHTPMSIDPTDQSHGRGSVSVSVTSERMFRGSTDAAAAAASQGFGGGGGGGYGGRLSEGGGGHHHHAHGHAQAHHHHNHHHAAAGAGGGMAQ